jgi:hypothetical protein
VAARCNILLLGVHFVGTISPEGIHHYLVRWICCLYHLFEFFDANMSHISLETPQPQYTANPIKAREQSDRETNTCTTSMMIGATNTITLAK